MQTTPHENLINKLHGFFSIRVVYHVLFWFLLFIVLILFDRSEGKFWFSFSNELINIFFYAIVVYFNLFYLVPNYLNKNKFIIYLALLMLFVLIVTPLKVVFLYFKFTNQPETQANLLTNQNLYFLSTFFIAGISTILNIVNDWARQRRDKQELERQTMQSELKFLRSQVNPHFLFNTLNSLYALTLKKSEKAPDIVLKLSEMMRYMLYECNERQVLLSKEINYMKNYLELEKLRQGKNIDVQFEVFGEVSNQKVAPLLFITFLENSFKHGLSNQISPGYVHARFEINGRDVFFTVENSKADSLPHQVHPRSGGIGLVNVNRRLNLLYPNLHNLQLIDKPNSYRVELKIELE